MNAGLAQLRGKMDPMYIIPNRPSGSHDDAHVKKENVGHLEFLKKWQKTISFSCFSESRLHRRLIFCEGDHLMKY